MKVDRISVDHATDSTLASSSKQLGWGGFVFLFLSLKSLHLLEEGGKGSRGSGARGHTEHTLSWMSEWAGASTRHF